MAQPGSALALGARGPQFDPGYTDHSECSKRLHLFEHENIFYIFVTN